MPVFDAITALQNFIWVFATVYVIVIMAYIITSWIRLPYSLNPVQRFLYDVCEPYLRLWRRMLPLAVGPMDFSPIVAVIALGLASKIVISLLDLLH